MKFNLRNFVWIALLFITYHSYAQFVVTNINDSGPGSLRQAVINANASVAKETITFNIPVAGPWQIDLQSTISIDNSNNVGMIIDGLTQPTSVFGNANNMVILDGSGFAGTGLSIAEPNVEVYGLYITNFTGGAGHGISTSTGSTDLVIGAPGRGNIISGNSANGINIDGSTNAIIQGNRIGTSANGLAADGNQAYGIQARFADNILIGGNSLAGEGNLISGNGAANHYAIHLRDGINAQVFGNRIGTDVNGDNDLGNRGGVNVTSGCDNPTIGGFGPGQTNVVAGCSGNPAILVSASAGPANQNVVIENNIMGLNAAGTTPIPNFSNGISLVSVNGVTSGNIIRGNTIAASGTTAVEVGGFLQTNIIIENNKVGTDINGNGGTAFGINSAGMSLSNVIGTDNTTNRVQILDNVINNSALNGLSIASLDNALIQRNYIGVEQDGITPGANTGAGILTTSGSINLEIGGIGNENIIAHNTGDGINFQSLAQTTAGTIIGINSYFCNGDVAIDFTMTPAVDAPVITAVSATDVDGTSTASIGSSVDIYTIDAGCTDNQGANYVGQATVAAGGLWNFTGVIDDTQTYVATVTDATNGISEFSASFAPNTSFITTWSTPGTQITIPTTGGVYNYDITWTNLTSPGLGDGSTTGAAGDFTINGLTSGHIYQVEISGTFPRIYFNSGSETDKILTVEQWGDIAWTSMANAFLDCSNLTIPAIDAPDLSGVTDMTAMLQGATSFNNPINHWVVDNILVMQNLFFDCDIFNQDLNLWNVGNVTDMSGIFSRAGAFNGNVGNWNVSSVNNFSNMFNAASSFDQPLNWTINTTPGAAIDMRAMFDSTPFNQDLNLWDMSEVVNTRSMFRNTTEFNGNIDNWDVSKVTDMLGMFLDADKFNRDLSSWMVNNVISMRNMFGNTLVYNQDLSAWNNRLGSLTEMAFMFSGAAAFNGDVSGWVVTSVLSMQGAFANTPIFNRSLASWDVSNVTNMQNMFTNATGFDQSLGSWDISNVTAMDFMFNNSGMSTASYDATLIGWESLDAGETQIPTGVDLGAIGLTYCAGATAHASLMGTYGWTINDAGQQCDFITTWKTDNPGTSGNNQITIPTDGTSTYNYDVVWGDGMSDTGVTGDITHTYAGPGTYVVSISGTFPAISFNNGGDREKILTVEQWGNNPWASMQNAFYGCTNLTVPAPDAPDLLLCVSMAQMFREATSFNAPIGTWIITGNNNTLRSMFQGATSFNQNISAWDVSGIMDMSFMFTDASAFNQPLTWANTSMVSDMSGMFRGATIFNQDLDTWNTANVIRMQLMFQFATSFNGNIDNWNVANVQFMSAMFSGATAFNRDISGWVTNSLTTTASMFQDATNFNRNLSGWNVSGVPSMSSMFANASSFNQPLTWDGTLSMVNSMSGMFLGATSFDQDISNWDVSGVTTMSSMFNGASDFNQDLSSWDVSGVTSMFSMFLNASSFNQSLGSWDISPVTAMDNMLSGSGLSIANYDATLIGWQSLPSLQSGIALGANGLTYCAGESARAALIASNLWVISGDSKNCPPPPPFIVTNTNDSGISSLRWVIANANTMAGADVVTFNIPTTDPNYNSADGTWTIQPNTPLPTITEALDIDAGTQPGTTNRRIIVDGQNTLSLFSVNTPGLEQVTFSDVQMVDATSSTSGAALSIISSFRVNVNNCAFIGNESIADGGAIAKLPSAATELNTVDSDFENNISGGGGGAIAGSFGNMDSRNCNFLNNQANGGNGGAIFNAVSMSFYIEASSFVGNTSSGHGGALNINTSSHSIINSTFSGNSATLNGGAIYSGAINGIDCRYVTFYQNSAAAGGGVYAEDGTVQFRNSVIASNTGGEYGLNIGVITSNGHNFVSLDPSSFFTNAGDISDTSTPLDPQLSTLVSNGTTYFHTPLTGSPLIDAGTNDPFNTDDQLGTSRPQGPAEDIGSIEFAAPPPLFFASSIPAKNQIGVALGSNISFTFDQDIEPSSVNTDNIIIRGEQSGILQGVFTGGGTPTITFAPDNAFKSGEVIRVTLTANIESTTATLLSDPYSFSFIATSGAAPETPAFFSQGSSIVTNFNGSFSVFAIDMEGDGDIDVLGVAALDDKISWFENDGSQNFTERVIATGIDEVKDAEAVDMDNDGDIDIVSVSTDDDRVIWYENNGSQNFTIRVISTSADGAFGVHADDLNGDGYMDVISASVFDNKVAWYENDGSQNFATRVLSTSANGALNVHSEDLDGDGDIDVLAAAEAGNTIYWYENDGVGGFTERIVSTNFNDARNMYTIDVNQDGHMDVITASEVDFKVSWFENDGSTNFTEHILTTVENGAGSVSGADMDGDGDIDILSTSFNAGNFTWYENDGNQNFTRSVILDIGGFAIESAPVDLDLDGDLDIIGAWSIGDEIVWFENTATTCTVLPTVDAGGDQRYCPGAPIMLNGSLGGSATTALWSTSGSGSFDDITALNAVYTPSATDESSGGTTLTLTVEAKDACPQVADDVIVALAQPLTAASPDIVANIQQAFIVDVVGTSIINNGDDITVTITQDATQGTTTINTDNTIFYTADVGAVGNDSFDYEICNQCGLCSVGVVAITIAAAPNADQVIVRNGISPNGDGKNDYFVLENIENAEPLNKVFIYNRWGDVVFEIENYDSTNPDKRFNGIGNDGEEVTSGVYFYKVEFGSGREELTGYLSLKK